MDIDQIKKSKDKLCEDIRVLLNKFEKETDLTVQALDFSRPSFCVIGGHNEIDLVKVIITI